MRKFQDFCITEILCEINFVDSRSAKTVDFAILGALNSVDLIISAYKKCKNSSKSKFRASKCVKMADFALLESPKLTSRKVLQIVNKFQCYLISGHGTQTRLYKMLECPSWFDE